MVSRFNGEGMLTFKEESSLVGDQVTSKVLRGVHQASDDGSAQIGTLDQVKKRRVVSSLLLNDDGAFNHGKGLGSLLLILGTKTLDGAKSLLLAAVANEPPGGLGGKEDEDQKGSLQSTC